MSKLFGLNQSEWAAQSGLTPVGHYNIMDHAHKALYDLTGINGDINYMMWYYLRDQGYGNDNLNTGDLVDLWDGSFGPVVDYFLLLETGDYLLLETGDKLILD